MLRSLGYAFVLSGIVYTGLKDLTKPLDRAASLEKSYLQSSLRAAGGFAATATGNDNFANPIHLGAAELLLASQAIGMFLLMASAMIITGLLRRTAAFMLAVYLIAHFFITNIDVTKPFSLDSLFVGKEEAALVDLAQLGALLVIAGTSKAVGRRSKETTVEVSTTAEGSKVTVKK